MTFGSDQASGSRPTVGGMSSATALHAPTPLRERSLAPDLARGLMLLFIALANAHTFLLEEGVVTVRGYPAGHGSTADGIVAGVLTLFVDARSYPLFAALFGYGLVQLYRREERAGSDWRTARKLLRRRGLWMTVIGVLHAFLLFYGDIIAAYGLVAVVLVSAVRWKDRTIFAVALVFLVLGSAVYGLAGIPTADLVTPALASESLVAAAFGRLEIFGLLAVIAWISTVCAFLAGIWAARRRILEKPSRHLVLLRRTALAGVGIATFGGVPMMLMTTGLVPATVGSGYGASALHAATGYAGGLGYAAAIALLAVRIGQRRGAFTQAVVAVGQRSMTCYLTQSVVWALLFPASTLGLGVELGVAVTPVISIATWLLTVGIAELMRRRDLRGPAEVLLRRLTYGHR
jgi:uncharacterized protein